MKKILFVLLLVWLGLSLSFSQDQKLVDPQSKTFFDTNKELGGDVTIKNSYLTYNNGIVTKNFEVESTYSGDFYFLAWLSTVQSPKGEIMKYGISVNNQPISDILPKKNDWHCAGIGNDKTVKLLEGINTITFSCPAPETPRVEFVRLVRDINKATISSSNYDAYNAKIAIDMQNYKSAPSDTTTLNLKSAPLAEYQVKENIASYYAYYATYYFTSGQTVNISTTTSGYQHVIELFSSSNPASYSWSAYGSSTGSLVANISSTGYYCIRLRNWRNNTAVGIATLNVNGTITNNAQIAGNAFGLSAKYTNDNFNFFSANLSSGDSRIWLEGAQGSIPGPIVAYNDDYMGLGYFNWGAHSRINGAFPNGVRAILLSSYGSYNPITHCDLYGYVYNADASYWSGNPYPFPSLLPDDAMTSAWWSAGYNCIGFSGGETVYRWPPSDPTYRPSGSTELESFDNYYASARYPGAMTYSHTDDSENGCIGLMGFSQTSDFTHAQCRRPANNHTHGYDWESKTGYQSWRIFHSKYSLGPDYFGNPSAYGSLQHYYSPTSTASSMTLKESVEAGLTKFEMVEYTQEEKDAFSKTIDNTSESLREDFKKKYSNWEETWKKPDLAFFSNPKLFIKSDEYTTFLKFCKTNNSYIIPFLAEVLSVNNALLINEFLGDLFDEEYASKMHLICKQNKEYDDNGVFIFHTQYTNIQKYFKSYLSKNGESKQKDSEQNKKKVFNEVIVFPNPASDNIEIKISLLIDSEIEVVIYGQYGAINLKSKKYYLMNGSSSLNFDVSSLKSGFYYLQLRTNHKENFVCQFNKL